jgi:hypothetical protein
MSKIKPVGKIATCESGDAFRGYSSGNHKEMEMKMLDDKTLEALGFTSNEAKMIQDGSITYYDFQMRARKMRKEQMRARKMRKDNEQD